jgi:hypothetical protein
LRAFLQLRECYPLRADNLHLAFYYKVHLQT